MLLSQELPQIHADIVAVRGHTAVSGHVTEVDTGGHWVAITLPDGGETPPTIDLWVKDGWDWQKHDDRAQYAFPIPAPDLSFLDIRTRAVQP
jgi:hypothetical protein